MAPPSTGEMVPAVLPTVPCRPTSTPAEPGARSRLLTKTVAEPAAKNASAAHRQTIAVRRDCACGSTSSRAIAPAYPPASSTLRTRVTDTPPAISRSASHPEASPATIMAKLGAADATPLSLSENPCTLTKYVGSHAKKNHTVQLVTNVVSKTAQTERWRSSALHPTAGGETSVASRTGGGASSIVANHSATHARPTTA